MKKYIQYIKNFYNRWNWLLMIIFLVLSILDFRFGIMAILCIIPAFAMAIRSGKKKFCAISCPRGNFLNRLLKNWYKNIKTPAFFRNEIFKNIVFIIMFSLFIIALIRTDGSATAIGFVFFRFILTSTIVGIILGVIFKPRTWCQICPLGQGTHIAGQISGKIQNITNKGS